jgi:carbamate kinase
MLTGMLVVAAIGRTALVGADEPPGGARPPAGEDAAAGLAEIAREHGLVVLHGPGPHHDLVARASEPVHDQRTYPLDLLGTDPAASAGQRLHATLARALPGRCVVTMSTTIVVDALDPAFRAPARPVGPPYAEDVARRLAKERGWVVAPGTEGEWRRMVACPAPRAVVEAPAIRALLAHGVVVCASAGGIPVVVDLDGAHHGVEALVDDDWAAALLARQLDADALLLLTDATSVRVDDGAGDPRALERTTAGDLQCVLDGSPLRATAEAAAWFAATVRRSAHIGTAADAVAVLRGEVGTHVAP